MTLREWVRPCLWLWVSPTTLPALLVAAATIPWRTRLRVRSGVIECHGPPIRWMLERLPNPALAMTLGHAVFGQTDAALDICREHELVHVRQYERWGPLFVPLYLGYSLVLHLRGRDGYRENPFEVEAYEYDRRRALGEFDAPPE